MSLKKIIGDLADFPTKTKNNISMIKMYIALNENIYLRTKGELKK